MKKAGSGEVLVWLWLSIWLMALLWLFSASVKRLETLVISVAKPVAWISCTDREDLRNRIATKESSMALKPETLASGLALVWTSILAKTSCWKLVLVIPQAISSSMSLRAAPYFSCNVRSCATNSKAWLRKLSRSFMMVRIGLIRLGFAAKASRSR